MIFKLKTYLTKHREVIRWLGLMPMGWFYSNLFIKLTALFLQLICFGLMVWIGFEGWNND